MKVKKERISHLSKERKEHTGIYDIVSLGRGRQYCKVDCPFCNRVVNCYLWSISGGGKKCECGAVIHRVAALRNPI
jgi:hypothetical protein